MMEITYRVVLKPLAGMDLCQFTVQNCTNRAEIGIPDFSRTE